MREKGMRIPPDAKKIIVIKIFLMRTVPERGK